MHYNWQRNTFTTFLCVEGSVVLVILYYPFYEYLIKCFLLSLQFEISCSQLTDLPGLCQHQHKQVAFSARSSTSMNAADAPRGCMGLTVLWQSLGCQSSEQDLSVKTRFIKDFSTELMCLGFGGFIFVRFFEFFPPPPSFYWLVLILHFFVGVTQIIFCTCVNTVRKKQNLWVVQDTQ